MGLSYPRDSAAPFRQKCPFRWFARRIPAGTYLAMRSGVSAIQKPKALEELVMTKNHIVLSIAAATVLAFAQGCSSAQEVEVTGEATAAATVTGPISIEFFEVPGAEEEADADESLSIKKIELAQPGPFKETIEVEGEKIRIFALAVVACPTAAAPQ